VPDSFQRSVRVAGLGVIAPVTFTEAASSGLDWFAALGSGSQPESLADAARNASEQEDIENGVARAWEYGDAVVTVHEQVVDITDHSRVEAAFAASRLRIAGLPLNDASTPPADAGAAGRQVTVGMHILEAVDAPEALRQRAAGAAPQRAVDYGRLSRDPFPHQVVGMGLPQLSAVRGTLGQHAIEVSARRRVHGSWPATCAAAISPQAPLQSLVYPPGLPAAPSAMAMQSADGSRPTLTPNTGSVAAMTAGYPSRYWSR
jgi:hypothetical protein